MAVKDLVVVPMETGEAAVPPEILPAVRGRTEIRMVLVVKVGTARVRVIATDPPRPRDGLDPDRAQAKAVRRVRPEVRARAVVPPALPAPSHVQVPLPVHLPAGRVRPPVQARARVAEAGHLLSLLKEAAE